MIISIFGPTAVGKSQLAVKVAEKLGGEIISADSMQVYRGLAVLTDQPSPELLKRIPHHLVGTISLDEEYSAGRYVQEAGVIIDDILSRGKLPILCGGTGLYIRAFLGGFGFAGRGDSHTREKWEQLIDAEGVEAAYKELLSLDPDSARNIDRKNPRRLVRALEAAESQGPSVIDETERLWSSQSEYQVLSLGILRERPVLYQQIDERVDIILTSGAIDEVASARKSPISRTVVQSIGFEEISKYLDGKLTMEQVADSIKQRSRRYAKRQLTWMRKMPDIVRIDVTGGSVNESVDEIMKRVLGRV